MHKENSIVMSSPRRRVFEAASDLSRWPVILPHYRWVHYIEKSPRKNLVVMSARRGWIPVRWTSEQVIDRDREEVRFYHLKAFTKGMKVVWSFKDTVEGTRVTIAHDLKPTIPIIGGLIADYVIGNFFIHYIAGQTLKHMKLHIEAENAVIPAALRKQ